MVVVFVVIVEQSGHITAMSVRQVLARRLRVWSAMRLRPSLSA